MQGNNKLVLITGRSKAQAISMESEGKFSKSYEEAVAIVYMNPVDVDNIGVVDKAILKLDNDKNIIVSVKKDSTIPRGVAFIPYGPWANILVDLDNSLGMPRYKQIEVFIEPIENGVTHIENIFIEKIGEKPVYLGRDLNDNNSLGERLIQAVCTFCGLACSDITIHLSGNKILGVSNGCSISSSKFVNIHRNRIAKPMIRLDSGNFVEVDLNTAINKAVNILINSKHPLIYGLSCTSNEAIEIAIEIAKILGGVIDSTTSICHGPTILSLSDIEIKLAKLNDLNNIDVALIWGANPAEAHPKLISMLRRYAKIIIVVDVRESETMKIADLGVMVKPGGDLEIIRAIRAMIRGYRVNQKSIMGVDIELIKRIVAIMRRARRGIVFVGMGLTMNRARYVNTLELALMIKDLEDYGEWYIQPLRGHFNVTGTNIIMRKSTGYPYGVDFAGFKPKMFPGSTTAIDMIRHRDIDAILVIASDPVAHMPIDCVRVLMEMPLIVIDSRWSLTASIADVVIPSGFVGIECSGSIYRMDEEQIKIDKLLINSSNKDICDIDILEEILKNIREKLGYVHGERDNSV